MKNNYQILKDMDSRKLPMIFWSSLVGFLAGMVVVLYRVVLTYAEKFAFGIYGYLRNHWIWVPVWFIILILLGYIVGKLIERNEMISGSGIPQVKGILMGYFKNSWFHTLWAKFIGGTLAIIGGLSLGREGPSIQLGACIAEGISKKIKSTRMEKKILLASGASAGLAAAFNAPLAGVMFVLEEIFKYFSPLILLSTMSAAIIADFVSKQIFGIAPVFHFDVPTSIPLNSYWLLIILGITLGLAGAFYNYITAVTQKLYKKLPGFNVRTKPILAFVMAGTLGLVFPVVLGGGHKIIEGLDLSTGMILLIGMLVVKFVFSMVSFGSGAPGGIFFPLLVMGAIIGAIFGNIAINYLGYPPALFYNFVIIAMAGYFTAIVRAPITGIVLITEMTGSFHHLLSLTVVSIIAYIVADVVRSVPIYDALLENLLKNKKIEIDENENNKKIIIDMVVHHDAPIVGKYISDIAWPSRCLLVSIKHRENEIIPKGNTKIQSGDYLMVLTDLNNEWQAREQLIQLTTTE
ncbi:MAG: chloride channel protein [Cellulosilyticaceae bacterium]